MSSHKLCIHKKRIYNCKLCDGRELCKEKDCEVRASCNYPNTTIMPLYCSKHKTVGMVCITGRKCKEDGCYKFPVYNSPGEIRGIYCSLHKKDGMIDVKNKKCEFADCIKRPHYNLPNIKPARFCATHKLDGMVNVINFLCIVDGCNTHPSFNIKGELGARYCATHKTTDMVDVTHIMCEYDGCNIRANYNIPNEPYGKYCVSHKLPSMVIIRHIKCKKDGCLVHPAYNYPENTIGIYCYTHKLDGMIDVYRLVCENKDCSNYGYYNFPNETTKRFCSLHKLDGMIRINRAWCYIKDCNTYPRYGLPGKPASHCAKHRQPGMIRRSKAKCKHPKCTEIATYGGANFIPLRCEEHKQDDDMNLLERTCIKCGLTMILDTTNQCEFCAPESFKRAALAKQNALMDYLDARKDLPKPISTDTTIDGGACGKERPDRIYDLDDKIIVVECDENQHRERACECEQTRMVNIGQSFGGIPIYFIRWNPDVYSPENDKKQQEEIQARYKLLGDLIRDIKNGKFSIPNDVLVSAIYLYYDDWDGLHSQKWHTLTPLVAKGGAGF